MFDVDWSDPNRESVGDRRARKDKKDKDKSKARDSQDGGHEEDEDQDDGADDQSGNRTSGSVRSSVSSAEKQFGFFGGKHRKKGTTSSSRKAKTQSVASSSLRSPTIEEQPHSEVASTSSPTHQRPSTSGADKSPSLPPKRFSSESPFLPLFLPSIYHLYTHHHQPLPCINISALDLFYLTAGSISLLDQKLLPWHHSSLLRRLQPSLPHSRTSP